jgi:hypothetical protein
MLRSLVCVITAVTALVGLGTLSVTAAPFSPTPLDAPALVERAACTVKRVRTVRPNGRVIYRSVRRCGPRIGPRCRVERQRIVRPNGRVIHKSVRRCR